MSPVCGASRGTASVPWLVAALALYLAMILASAWRWGLLLGAQGIPFTFGRLTSSFLVATFFNNFLPSNIGGDVIRIADTAPAAGSKTLATTVVLIDRGHRAARLVLMAAVGRVGWASARRRSARSVPACCGRASASRHGRDARAADAGEASRGCCSRCACCTPSGWTRGSSG